MTPQLNNLSSADRWMGGLALLGAILLFFGVPLRHPLMLFDLAAPLMAWQLWRRRGALMTRLASWRSPLLWVLLAAAWALLAAIIQLIRGAAPFYDTAIALYMLLACAFYAVTPLPPPRLCLAVAAGMLGCCLVVFLLGGHCSETAAAASRLFYTEQNLLGAAGSVLARRFQFFFANPNLLGSAYVLPYLLALPWLKERLESGGGCRWRTWTLLAAAMLLGALPLLHSVSKHLLLTFGLCCGLLASLPQMRRIGSRLLAPLLTALLGLLLALTVWFRTYPAVRRCPWVDFGARSNYSTHQEVYLDIIRGSGPAGALFGHGVDELHLLYPQFADGEKIASILEAYYGHKLDGTFTDFMDPHNEYLNTASHFGIPAILLLAVAAWMLFRASWRLHFIPGCCAVVALAFACLWDDLSSKRWIWLYAGLLMQFAWRCSPPSSDSISPTPPETTS